jgi:hypothetical protein
MNLVGHVAVALVADQTRPSADFLVGCMLPDLAAIARVRLARPADALGAGVEFHHACDSAFHDGAWFRNANVELRDELARAGVVRGAARAGSHAGLEMLLDGALVDDSRVLEAASDALSAVARNAEALAELAPQETRAVAAERFHRIGSSLDPARYRDVWFVAERLHGMTRGRRRIELPAAQIGTVAGVLDATREQVADVAVDVLSAVRRDVAPVS